jgi:spore coat protein U-like protein
MTIARPNRLVAARGAAHVAQKSKSAVPQILKVAKRKKFNGCLRSRRDADLEIGPTAGWGTCATGTVPGCALNPIWQRVVQRGAILLLLFLGSFSAKAAGSQLRLEVDNVDWRGGTRVTYGVFDSGEYAQTVYFKVRLTGAPVPFFVTFGNVGGAGSERRAAQGGDSLRYEIYDSVTRRAALRDLPAATASEVLSGAFAAGEDLKELSYVILVPPEQVRPSGVYTQPIKITVYQGTRDSYLEKDAKTVVFSIRVDSVAELSLGEAGAPFDARAKGHRLDFGNLEKSQAKGVDIRVRSNAGYHITMESENGGLMKNIDPRHPVTIPYSLQINSAAVSLRRIGQTVLTRGSRLTDRNGDLHQVLVTIGQVGNAWAGTYQDNIILTVVSDN